RLENDVEDSGEESGGEPQACPGIGAGLVPRILALVAIATLVTAPIQNGISRKLETRADVSALSAAKDAAAFTALQRSLALRSHADPTPPAWSQWWFGSHPTVLERIAVARSSLGRNSLGR
ncbi:MAG: M48 family metalloprotease, partial [Nocardioidaceae bacterium]|nr:M48 family metalloprotease [Nocardioidaceae bacterium]